MARRAGLLALVAAALAVAVLASCAVTAPVHDGPVTEHFDGTRFSWDPPLDKDFGDFLRWRLQREPEGTWTMERDLPRALPPPRRLDDGLRTTFINHATVLIQFPGLNLLTDPIWSERASPVGWAGPRRHRPPGVGFEDLPPVDVVLLSHNHYDHMDAATLERLAADHDPLFIMPLGNCVYLDLDDRGRCIELDWWESRSLPAGARIHAVPVRHWSRRGLFDTNRALWAGYVIEAAGRRVYFAGDTGFDDHFAETARRLGPPDLALLPIGSYLPRWFMAPQHISPAEAVAAHRALGAARSMAIHFGTFPLADDGQEQPVRELEQALDAAGLPAETFWIPAQGAHRHWPSAAEGGNVGS